MRACMTASGGVMFIPDTIERKKCKTSYTELVEDKAEDVSNNETPIMQKPRRTLFGRRKVTPESNSKAA